VTQRTPLSEIEKSIAAKVASASFPPGTASKRFARNIGDGYVNELSSKGRRFLAFVAHRFRRQYRLTSAELDWVAEWLTYEEYEVPAAPAPQEEPTLPGIMAKEPEQMTLSEVYGEIHV